MNFEDMMVTPVMYQDIPSSFMMQPMPMMMPGMMAGMYPMYGIGPMQPVLNDDKFERLEKKEAESKNSAAKAGIALATLTALGLFVFKGKVKPKVKPITKGKFISKAKIMPRLRLAKQKIKAFGRKIKGFFTKKTTP